LLTLQRFNENRCRPLAAFMLKILDHVSSSERGAEMAASSHRRNNVQGNTFSNLCDYFKYFFLTFTGIFGSLLVLVYYATLQTSKPFYMLKSSSFFRDRR